MVNPPLHIGLPHAQTHELLRQNFSSASYFPQKANARDIWTLSFLVDRLNGLIKLPFIFQEGQIIQQMVRRGDTVWTSVEFRFQSLSFLANITELLTWLGEREYITLIKKEITVLDGICSFSRLILYGHASYQESLILSSLREDISSSVYDRERKRKEYQFHRLQLSSHLTYLTCMALWLIGLSTRIHFPRKLIRTLHFASFIFGLMSMQYNQESLLPSGYRFRLLSFRGLYEL